MSTPRNGTLGDVWLVYRREIDARLKSKGYFIGMLFMVIAVFGLVAGLYYANAPKTHTVAVCGAAQSSFGTPPEDIRLTSCADEQTARDRVTDKDVDAAVTITGSRVSVLTRTDTPTQAKSSAITLAQVWATQRAYDRQQIDTQQLNLDVAAAGPTLVTVGGNGPNGTEIGAAISMVVVLFMQIIGQGSLVAQGVVEEKSTRVIEVLLATLSPLRLMMGKVAGIGTAAVLQIVVLVAAVVGARSMFGDQAEGLPSTAALISATLWFLLTFTLFAYLFAAAGSLVSRPEDLQAVLMPVMVLALAPVGIAAAAAGDLNAGWVGIVQYVPPFSGLLMPLQASVGNVSLLQQLVAAALMVVATSACVWLAARIYANSVLKIGSVVRWRHALVA
ncbi:ABC transporter permease [Actinacidiphila sp. bgisy167]|uniref:ABC transporter permease n=1 Tax=Actinacidiphila sp. bgisy167 TaxID=3413797 RepID=UPI003D72A612